MNNYSNRIQVFLHPQRQHIALYSLWHKDAFLKIIITMATGTELDLG